MNKKIYYNGEIITLNQSTNSISALIIEDGIIKKIGETEELLKEKIDAEIIDLEGKTVLPGFIDPHGHIVAIAQSLMMPNFGEVKSIEEFTEKLKKALEENPPKEGEWLLGLGYDNSKFEGGRHPNKFDLDKISKEIPIFITHASGHIAAVNSKVLELFGYSNEGFEVPEGGVVQRVQGTSEALGVLEENAFLDGEKKKVIGAPSAETVMKSLVKAQDLYASYGITTCQDASVDNGIHQLLAGAAAYNMLKIDIVGQAIQQVTATLLENRGKAKAEYNNHYKLLGAKMWLDGSPQAKTAWLTKPYHVVPEGADKNFAGYKIQEDEVVINYIKNCIDNNWQVNAHCNGDASGDQFIRCYKKALELSENKTDLRPVMVHAQTVREDQLDEMEKIGIIPTFFLDHIWYWGDYHYDSVLGPERAGRISPAASALKRGMNYTFHQDPPVVMPNMMLAIHNAVNRKTQSGRILGEDQKIAVIDAIKGVTINGAYQYFEEDIKGTLEVGKLADLVILDKNPLTVKEEEIKDIKILETIKEGKTVFKA
ncbi:MAG: amidohydrolase [Sarcina sp.]